MTTGALRAAAALAAGGVALDAVVAIMFPGSGPLAGRIVAPLVATGWICVVGLTIRRSPTVAWVASVLAASFAAVDVTGALRAGTSAQLSVAAVLGATVISDLSMAAAAAVAGAYVFATFRAGGTWVAAVRVIVALGAVALATVFVLDVGALAWVSADRLVGGIAPGRWLTRLALGEIVAFAVLGLVGDARRPFRRARRRLVSEELIAVPAPSTPRTDRIARAVHLARLFAEEVIAGMRAGAIAAARRSERESFAADLHALVLPELRMAAAAADASGAPSPVRARVRDALADTESLMAGHHSPLLETFGLVRALEWLAERTEARSDVRVLLDVVAEDGRAPREVERAAFRIALLALDNVVRHAPSASVLVRLAVERSRLSLDLSDDGPGIEPGVLPDAVSRGRRGLGDMRTEAQNVAAVLELRSTADGPTGTTISFRWPGP